MYISTIIQIFKDVMYLKESDDIDLDKSLFSDYGMSSIDYIDFVYELKKHLNINVTPETLWPINKWATIGDYYSFESKEWTAEGLSAVNNLLGLTGDKMVDKNIQFKDLYLYFTPNYINKRVVDIAESNA